MSFVERLSSTLERLRLRGREARGTRHDTNWYPEPDPTMLKSVLALDHAQLTAVAIRARQMMVERIEDGILGVRLLGGESGINLTFEEWLDLQVFTCDLAGCNTPCMPCKHEDMLRSWIATTNMSLHRRGEKGFTLIYGGYASFYLITGRDSLY